MKLRVTFFSLALLFASPALADKVAVLNTPADILRSKMEIIENTGSGAEILASDFIYRGDESGLMKLAALIEAQRRGAVSRNIVDAPHFLLPSAYVKAAMDEGVDFRIFNPPSLWRPGRSTVRFHDKIVLSGDTYHVGGTNTGDEYHGIGNHLLKDRDVRVEGKSSAQAREHFNEIWNSDWVKRPQVIVASEEEVKKHRAAKWKRKERLDKIFGLVQKFGTPKNAEELSRLSGEKISEADFEAAKRVVFKVELDSPDIMAGGERELITQAELDQAKKELAAARERWKAMKANQGWVKPMAWFDGGDHKVTFHSDRLGRKRKLPGGIAAVEQEAVKAAKKTVVMATPYLVLSDGYREALRRDPSDPKEISVLTNSYASSDNKLTQGHYELHLPETAKLGFTLHEFPAGATMHAKTTVIDGYRTFITSVNKDYRSEFLNTETGVEIESRQVAQKVEAMIREDMARGKLVAKDGKLLEHREFCATFFGKLLLKSLERQL